MVDRFEGRRDPDPRCAKWEFCASRSPKVSGNDGYRFESVEGSLREVERTVRERAP